MIRHTFAALSFCGLATIATGAQAGVVNHADLNGIRTFQDTATGRVWADLDQFLVPGEDDEPVFQFADRAGYLNALIAAGFVWATTAETLVLTSNVASSTSAERAAAFAAMSTDFGMLIESISGYADAGGGAADLIRMGVGSWSVTPLNAMPGALNDAGIWAYYAGGQNNVPEPGSLLLAGMALALMAPWVPASRRGRSTS